VSSSRTDASSLVAVTMPQMGISVAEGTITEWRKRPGDWVDADEVICEVTTDKVDVEIPAPASGRVERLLAEPGQTLAVGEPIAEIDPSAKPGEAHPDEDRHEERSPDRSAAGPVAAGPSPDRAPESARSGAGPATPPADQPSIAPAEETAERDRSGAGPAAPPAGERPELDRSRFYSPVVRRIAEEHGVDLNQVEGTGIGGRVRKRDVLAFVEGGSEAAGGRPLHIESPYRPGATPRGNGAEEPATAGAGASAPPTGPGSEAAQGPATPGGRREPMSIMRQQIARHMVESRRTSAHCTTIVEVDFSRVAGRRAELREAMGRRGVRLTYLAFVARTTVLALAEHPILNASIEGEEIVYHDDVNLGIAVALEEGLIVPVIPRAQRLSLEGTAAAINDLAERARSKQLAPDEVHGGTFTITNPGQFGAVLATPIINQPQVAILDLEAVVKRPVVIEEGGTDAIAIRPMSYLCMSWDHRALDGAVAARFLASVRERLEGGEIE
jgi:pyruvate dehydrogenase E2 component (dihydrolipoamide acetyltransferase)